MSLKGSLPRSLWSKMQRLYRSGLARGAAGSLALRALYYLLTFAAAILLGRVLGAREYGHFAYAVSWVVLLNFAATMGLAKLLTRETARNKALQAWGELRGVLNWANRTVLVLSVLVTSGGVVFAWVLSDRLGLQAARPLVLAMLIIPFLAFLTIWQGAIRGLGHVVISLISRLLIRPLLFVALIIGLALSVELTAEMAVVVRLASVAVAALVSMVLLRLYLPQAAKEAPAVSRPSIWLKSGISFMAAGLAGIANERISVILVGTLIGGEATGLYEASRKGAMFVMFLPGAISTVIAPAVARLYASEEHERLQKLVALSVRWGLLGAVCVAAAFVLLGNWFLVLFGEEFLQARALLIMLCLAAVIRVGLGPTSVLLNMTGHELWTALGAGLGVALNAGIAALLIPRWGVEGAGLAYILSTIFYKLFGALAIYRTTGVLAWFGARGQDGTSGG